jgi:exo-beta-1,3-glucanase (GH17 family)
MLTPDSGAGAALGAQIAAQVNQQAVQIESSAKNFVAAAGTGFHLEPEAAATLIKACQDSLHELEQLSN